MIRDEVVDRVHESPLSAHAEDIIKALAPSARIVVGDELKGNSDAGISHFGGEPLLPPGIAWPRWDRRELLTAKIARNEAKFRANPRATGLRDSAEKMRGQLSEPPIPLMFIGQLSLGELHKSVALHEWPNQGSLAFFFDSSYTSCGFDPLDRGFCRVLFTPEENLVPLRSPDDLSEDVIWPTRRLSFRGEWTLPTYLTLHGEQNPIWRSDAYAQLLEDLSGSLDGEALHRAGGHPQEVQGDMRLECQLVTNGLYCGDQTGYKDPRRIELEKTASDWQLLLQVDSDDRMKWMWGDVGRIYFWARKQDIQIGNFGDVWTVFQCH